MKPFLKKTFTLFMQGLLTLLPLIVSVYVLYLFLSLMEGVAENLLVILPSDLSRIPGVFMFLKSLTIGLLFFAITFFGLMMRTVIGRALLTWMDAVFARIPGISSIYIATKQVVEVFRSGKKQIFTNPVLAEYPSPGIWSIGFNTGEMVDACVVDDDLKRYTIFIPTTPNPTSGYLAVLSERQIRKLDSTVEEAIKLVLTGGIVKKDNGKHPPGDTTKEPGGERHESGNE